ncbi:hypothetical protein Tco_0278245 [Tanacetum coccineum]
MAESENRLPQQPPQAHKGWAITLSGLKVASVFVLMEDLSLPRDALFLGIDSSTHTIMTVGYAQAGRGPVTINYANSTLEKAILEMNPHRWTKTEAEIGDVLPDIRYKKQCLAALYGTKIMLKIRHFPGIFLSIQATE